MIVGVDEVGRGAWAGPLVVGAVLLGGTVPIGLTDSKKLSKKERERLDIEVRRSALGIGLGWVSAKHIDAVGLTEALKLATRRALAHIRHDFDEIIIDGTIRLSDDPRVTLMKKADLLVPSVSAASIVAKVARDNYMHYVDDVFPGYKFGSHVGYGTAVHRAAIAAQGVTPLHRLSFGPLAGYSDTAIVIEEKVTSRPVAMTIGRVAEDVAAQYLESQGHEILERNWRTKFCEIDIVSRHEGFIYFSEVKYRKDAKHGDGLAAITKTKLRQMKFAAEYFIVKHKLVDTDRQLVAIAVTDEPPRVTDLVKIT